MYPEVLQFKTLPHEKTLCFFSGNCKHLIGKVKPKQDIGYL